MLSKNEERPGKYGRFPSERSFEELLSKGVVVLDKQSGPSSHQVLEDLKKVLGINKAGHAGTLDPKVTGVLVGGLGKGTKLMEFLQRGTKEYIGLMYLHSMPDEDNLRKVMNSFIGKIRQTPSVVSAVSRKEREREVYELEILEMEGQYVLLRALVQHGTYIRKLCHDIGEELGTGAHMLELRRTKSGCFSEVTSVSLTRLADLMEVYNESVDKQPVESELRRYIFPIEEALGNFRKVIVRDSAVDRLAYGGDLAVPGVVRLDEGIEKGEVVCLLTLKGELISIGTALLDSEEVMKKEKGFFVKTRKVFMEPGVYPALWNSGEQK